MSGTFECLTAFSVNISGNPMPSSHHILWIAAVVIMASVTAGCVTDQHSEFRGHVTWGTPVAVAGATNSASIQEIGEDFQILNPAYTNALTGFGWGDGKLIIIHDRQNYADRDYRLASNAVQAVYFAEPGTGVGQWFLGIDAAKRDQVPGLHHLYGTFDIEQWRTTIAFRLRLKMQSAGPDLVKVNGILTEYESVRFNPVEWFFMLLGAMGVGED
jgi:hypothetical protein